MGTHDRAYNKVQFEDWMERVDRAVQNRIGLSYLDLPDVAYWDYFEDGMTPTQVAKIVIQEAM